MLWIITHGGASRTGQVSVQTHIRAFVVMIAPFVAGILVHVGDPRIIIALGVCFLFATWLVGRRLRLMELIIPERTPIIRNERYATDTLYLTYGLLLNAFDCLWPLALVIALGEPISRPSQSIALAEDHLREAP